MIIENGTAAIIIADLIAPKPPEINSTPITAENITPQITMCVLLLLGITPTELIVLTHKIAESADVTKKVVNSTKINKVIIG